MRKMNLKEGRKEGVMVDSDGANKERERERDGSEGRIYSAKSSRHHQVQQNKQDTTIGIKLLFKGKK
jgi:hypothetical protein